jgi:hypothetical protein
MRFYGEDKSKCRDCGHPIQIQEKGLMGPILLHKTKRGLKEICVCGYRKAR